EAHSAVTDFPATLASSHLVDHGVLIFLIGSLRHCFAHPSLLSSQHSLPPDQSARGAVRRASISSCTAARRARRSSITPSRGVYPSAIISKAVRSASSAASSSCQRSPSGTLGEGRYRASLTLSRIALSW